VLDPWWIRVGVASRRPQRSLRDCQHCRELWLRFSIVTYINSFLTMPGILNTQKQAVCDLYTASDVQVYVRSPLVDDGAATKTHDISVNVGCLLLFLLLGRPEII
jgi:hypothetical protein